MAYVMNRRGIYRTGFRPAPRATNPFAAAQLSGVPARRVASPFAPEHLRLEQHYPFTASGRYGLHGLGDTVPNGAVVQYQGQWATTVDTTPDGQLAAVVAALQADGFHIVSSSETGGFWSELLFGGNGFTATITLQVANGMGFAQPSDIAAIVDHEAFTASGIMPSGSAASVISLPNSTPGVSLPATPTDWGTWLQQNALWIGLGLVGVVILPEILEKF